MPASIRTSTTRSCPCAAACISAVRPRLSVSFGSPFFSSSAATACLRPRYADVSSSCEGQSGEGVSTDARGTAVLRRCVRVPSSR